MCLYVSDICPGLCFFLCVYPVSTSEDTSLLTAPGGIGPLAPPSLGEPGHILTVTTKRGWSTERMVGKEQERGQWLSCPLTPLPSSHPNSWLSQGIWAMCLPRGLEEEAEQAWNSPCLDVSCQGHGHVGFVLVPQPGTVHGTEQTHPIVCCQKRSEIMLNRSRGRGPPLITHLLLHPLVYGV